MGGIPSSLLILMDWSLRKLEKEEIECRMRRLPKRSREARVRAGDGVVGLSLFVSNGEANTVSMVDLDQMEVIRSIPVGKAPADMVASGDGRYVFVALHEEGSVSVIDAAKGEIIKRLEVQKSPVHVYLHPDGDTVWVGNDLSASISILDAHRLDVQTHVSTGKGHHKMAFTPDGGYAFVTNIVAGTVSVVDCDTHQVLATIPSGRGPHMLRNALDQMWDAPWIAIFPGLTILVTVLATNFIGDGLRDALDPRLGEATK